MELRHVRRGAASDRSDSGRHPAPPFEASRLNVEWCRVLAPIDGRISRKFVTPGNLVSGGSGAGTLLTRINSGRSDLLLHRCR